MENIKYLIIFSFLLISFACEKEKPIGAQAQIAFCDPYCTQFYSHSIDSFGNKKRWDDVLQNLDIDQDGTVDVILDFYHYYGEGYNGEAGGKFGLSLEITNLDWHVLTYNSTNYTCRDTFTGLDDFNMEHTSYVSYSCTEQDNFLYISTNYVTKIFPQSELDNISVDNSSQGPITVHETLIGDQNTDDGLGANDLPPSNYRHRITFIGDFKFGVEDGYIVFSKNPGASNPDYYGVKLELFDTVTSLYGGTIPTGLNIYKGEKLN